MKFLKLILLAYMNVQLLILWSRNYKSIFFFSGHIVVKDVLTVISTNISGKISKTEISQRKVSW